MFVTVVVSKLTGKTVQCRREYGCVIIVMPLNGLSDRTKN